MKKLGRLILGATAVMFLASCTGPDHTYSKGTWRLEIYRTYAKGTESEGSFGLLFKDGRPVYPKSVGEVIETDLGRMKYYRNPTDQHQMFDTVGWNFENQEKSK